MKAKFLSYSGKDKVGLGGGGETGLQEELLTFCTLGHNRGTRWQARKCPRGSQERFDYCLGPKAHSPSYLGEVSMDP